jgi:hypothetical protein
LFRAGSLPFEVVELLLHLGFLGCDAFQDGPFFPAPFSSFDPASGGSLNAGQSSTLPLPKVM